MSTGRKNGLMSRTQTDRQTYRQTDRCVHVHHADQGWGNNEEQRQDIN